jgi:hypothetical protein
LARNPLQIGDDTNPLASAPFTVGDPTDPMVVAGARNTASAVDKLGQWLADKHAEGVKAGNWVGGWPWQGGHPTWQAAKGAVDEYAQGMLLGTTSSGGGLRAYHGSPHKFDAFSDHAIGTGEGAQAYGYGHYVAENEGVARGYRDALTAEKGRGHYWQDASGKKVDTEALRNLPEGHPDSMAANMLHQRGSVDEAIADVTKYGPSAFAGGKPEMDATLKGLQAMKDRGLERVVDKGHMYEVNVAADPERFLHWDKPLSEQHPDVKDAAHAALLKRGIDRTLASYIVNNKTGRDLHSTLSRGEYRPDLMAPEAGAPGAALALKEAGIPGIRYLDAGSRGAKGEPTHNAVVFDPATMEIIRRYGLAGLMGGGAAAATQQQQPNALVVP